MALRSLRFRFLLATAGLVLSIIAGAERRDRVAEEVAIRRMASLGRLWGVVKFFHPFLAYKEIDWDAALIKTLPKVRSAASADDYRVAVDQMLALLGDPATHVEMPSSAGAAIPSVPASSAKELFRAMDGVFVVRLTAIAEQFASNRQSIGDLVNRLRAIGSAKAVVLDCRGSGPGSKEKAYEYDLLLREAVAEIADQPVTLSSQRFRLHSGYVPAAGSTSGGYFSALSAEAPPVIAGRRRSGTRIPAAVLVNSHSPPAPEILGGLRSARLITLVQHGDIRGPSGETTYEMSLGEGVVARVRTTEMVNPDGTSGLESDIKVLESGDSPNDDPALAAALKAVRQGSHARRSTKPLPAPVLRSTADEPYPGMEAPGADHRLLALFRFWNVINYFFPYKDLIGEPWEGVLTRFIPRFDATGDALDYQRAVHELVASIHDSHGFVRGTNRLRSSLGTHWPPVACRIIAGMPVVIRVGEAVKEIALGDTLVEVDGVPAAIALERIGRLFAASTAPGKAQTAMRWLLAGAPNSKVTLLVQSLGGDKRSVVLERSLTMDAYSAGVAGRTRNTPIFQVLPNGIGYIDLDRLPLEDVDKAMDAVQNTPGLIFDMRGYPNGTAWSIAPRLTTRTNVTGALFRRPLISGRDLGNTDFAAPYYGFAQPIPPPKSPTYRGRVVMLIDESAISQAEHTCLFFEAATEVTFIGTPTAGANGDITSLVLPGNLQVSFSGHDVRHADGRQLQRVGIQPHIRVEPTIQGIREGRDEVLESALKFLTDAKK